MRVLGVDQSYTGFGYSIEGVSKKKSFPISKYDSEIARLDAIEMWFWDVVEQAKSNGGVHLMVMEGYANGAKFGREVAGELGGVIKLTGWRLLGGHILVVPPTSLKKFVTGKGNAKKNEMLLGVYKKWGQSFADDNQADAFALEMFGLAYLDVQNNVGGYLKYETEAIEAVRKAQ